MGRKGLLRNVFYWGIALSIIGSMLILGYAEAQTKPTPKYGGILRNVEAAGAPGSFGWPPEAVGNDALGMKPALECLVRQDSMGTIYPWLATAWKVAPDKKSITFTLRKGIKFHDGSDFNAKVVKFNLDAQKAAKVAGTQSWTSIDAIDDYTVRINLSAYDNILIGYLFGNLGTIVSQASFEKNGKEWAKLNPVGTGPFKFVSFQRDVVTKFKRNDDYWDKGKPYLDGVELHVIKDPMTQQAALQAGEVEVVGMDYGKMAADLKAMGFELQAEASGTVMLLPDSVNPDSPLADKRVREAVEYAIDREAIAKAKSYGLWKAAYQLPPAGTLAYNPNFQGRRFNPDKAKQLLAEAGYPNGFKTKIIPMPFGIDRDIMVSIQAFLAKVGIQVDLDFVDYGKYSEYRRKGWRNAFLCQPIGLFPNYNRVLEWYFGADSLDFPSVKRPDGFQALLNESLGTIDLEKEKVVKVVMKAFDETMLIPIHDTGRAYAVQKYVHDTQHMAWGSWTNWRPDLAWLSK
jgi:peptide/nickel transport system substrate-binding protein